MLIFKAVEIAGCGGGYHCQLKAPETKNVIDASHWPTCGNTGISLNL